MYTVHRQLGPQHRIGDAASVERESATDALNYIRMHWRNEWVWIEGPNGEQLTTADLYIRTVDEREA